MYNGIPYGVGAHTDTRTLGSVMQNAITMSSGPMSQDMKTALDGAGMYDMTRQMNLGEYKGDLSILDRFIQEQPKKVHQLVTYKNPDRVVDYVLQSNHKPYAQIVNSLSKRKKALTPVMWEYLRAHGGKKAYENLVARQTHYMHFTDIVNLIQEAYAKHEVLAMPAVINWDNRTMYSRHEPRPGAVSILKTINRLSDDYLQRKGDPNPVLFKWEHKIPFELASVLAGVDGETIAQHGSSKAKELKLSIEKFDGGSIFKAARVNQHLGVYDVTVTLLLKNKMFLDRFKNASEEEQMDLYGTVPSWRLLNLAKNPHGCWHGSGNQMYGSMAPSVPEPHYPTYETLLELKKDALRSTPGQRVFFRLTAERFGDNKDAWESLRELWRTWDGNLGDLLDTAEAI